MSKEDFQLGNMRLVYIEKTLNLVAWDWCLKKTLNDVTWNWYLEKTLNWRQEKNQHGYIAVVYREDLLRSNMVHVSKDVSLQGNIALLSSEDS